VPLNKAASTGKAVLDSPYFVHSSPISR
jgi:hypothetical protein